MLSSSRNPFKSFDDYANITPLYGKHYIAIDKSPSSTIDYCAYEGKCYLLKRTGLFKAEVEKAASEIHHYFIGYGTNIDVIRQNQHYYIASRGIKNFHEGRGSSSKITCSEMGATWSDGDISKPIYGIGSIYALTKYFGDPDLHSGNYGFQEQPDYFRILKIDNEHTFSFSAEDDKEHQDYELLEFWKFIKSEWYRIEINTMFSKIANTDFSIIENILHTNITSNEVECSRSMISEMISECSDIEQDNKDMLEKHLKELDKENPEQYGVKKIEAQLKQRHQQLKQEQSHLKNGTNFQFQFFRPAPPSIAKHTDLTSTSGHFAKQ